MERRTQRNGAVSGRRGLQRRLRLARTPGPAPCLGAVTVGGDSNALHRRGRPLLPGVPRAAVLALAWLVLVPLSAAACAVCFGAAEGAETAGLRAGILVLLGMVALVFAAVAGFLFAARRRLHRSHGQPTETPRSLSDSDRLLGVGRDGPKAAPRAAVLGR